MYGFIQMVQSIACPPLARQVVSSLLGRVIPKTIIKWYKLPPCMARHALG